MLDDYTAFSKVNAHLLNPPTPLKHVPIRVYIPSSPPDASGSAPGSFRVMQSLVAPRLANRKFFLLSDETKLYDSIFFDLLFLRASPLLLLFRLVHAGAGAAEGRKH